MDGIEPNTALHQEPDRAGDETMPGMKTIEAVSRRQAFATVAGGISLIAAPAIVRAQAPLKVTFAQQRGLLYLRVDVMVNGGILQKEADKLGLGKIEATATALSGPGPVLDAILSGAADYGTAALPSLLTLWERTRGSANEVKAVGTDLNVPKKLYINNPNAKSIYRFQRTDPTALPTVRFSATARILTVAAVE